MTRHQRIKNAIVKVAESYEDVFRRGMIDQHAENAQKMNGTADLVDVGGNVAGWGGGALSLWDMFRGLKSRRAPGPNAPLETAEIFKPTVIREEFSVRNMNDGSHVLAKNYPYVGSDGGIHSQFKVNTPYGKASCRSLSHLQPLPEMMGIGYDGNAGVMCSSGMATSYKPSYTKTSVPTVYKKPKASGRRVGRGALGLIASIAAQLGLNAYADKLRAGAAEEMSMAEEIRNDRYR